MTLPYSIHCSSSNYYKEIEDSSLSPKIRDAIAPTKMRAVHRMDRSYMRVKMTSKQLGFRFPWLQILGTGNSNLVNNVQPMHVSTKDADLHLASHHYYCIRSGSRAAAGMI